MKKTNGYALAYLRCGNAANGNVARTSMNLALDRQRNNISAIAGDLGLDIVEEFVDICPSGKLLCREGFENLLGFINHQDKTSKAYPRYLIVSSMDRLTRHYCEHQLLLDILKVYGLTLVANKEKLLWADLMWPYLKYASEQTDSPTF
jgi:DNA invertase Pin-like site-specific DNA recombinase